MRYFIFIALFISQTCYSQDEKGIIFLFDKREDSILIKENLEIYKLDDKHSFAYDREKHKKTEVTYESIRCKMIESFSKFLEINKARKYPDFLSDYSFYIFIKEYNNSGCLIEVEKIWLVEDKIID